MPSKPKVQPIAGTALDPTIQFAKLAIKVLEGSRWVEKKFDLIYSYRAITIAERMARESGAPVNLLAGLESLGNLSAEQLQGLLYAAMIPAYPNITIAEVAALIRLDTIAAVTMAIAEAYRNSMPPDPLDAVAAWWRAAAAAS